MWAVVAQHFEVEGYSPYDKSSYCCTLICLLTVASVSTDEFLDFFLFGFNLIREMLKGTEAWLPSDVVQPRAFLHTAYAKLGILVHTWKIQKGNWLQNSSPQLLYFLRTSASQHIVSVNVFLSVHTLFWQGTDKACWSHQDCYIIPCRR